MASLALLLLLLLDAPTGSSAKKVEVAINCPSRPADVTIVIKDLEKPEETDTPHQLWPEKEKFTTTLQVEELNIFDGTPASLRLKGQRTNCRKATITKRVAYYAFKCGTEAKNLHVELTAKPGTPKLSVLYERRLKADTKDHDCVEEGMVYGKDDIVDVSPDEVLVLKFGTVKAGAPGYEPPPIRSRDGNLVIDGVTFNRVQLQEKLIRQHVAWTGYLSSIEIDWYSNTLKNLQQLSIGPVEHVEPKK